MHQNEHRILGPPGTGKTTFLANQIQNAAEKHGAHNVVVASYTRAAAAELNSRQLPIPRENLGTLHGICYRQLKQYEIAEVKASEFNEEYPQDAISVSGGGKMDEMLVDASFGTDGDRHLNTYNLFRAKCLPLNTMDNPAINWCRKWERWKDKHEYIDFTDMINITITQDKCIAGDPKIGIYDECQDFNKLEMKLIRHWSKFQEHILLAGDDDQTIFSFAGASPEAFLYPEIPAERKRILKQSWRLPKAVHNYSQQWIKQIKKREPKEFLPRDVEGSVNYITSSCKAPDKAVELAAKYAQAGKSVMLLASCGYLLNPIKTKLRAAGLPYHNPYRTSRGDWNPLGGFYGKHSGKVSTRERLMSFLDEALGVSGINYWPADKLAKWIELVKVRDILKKGGKEKIISIMEDRHGVIDNEVEFYNEVFKEFALERALKRDIEWFTDSLLSAKRNAVEYPLTVYQKHGRKALEDKPKIILGTIHSVKGGEADAVILFPDLSLAAMQEYCVDKDSTIRTFYVGMTRAKESLTICQPSSKMCVKL